MIFTFPDFDVLTLALQGGVTPKVNQSPARATFHEDGSISVEPSVTIAKKYRTELEKLGVTIVRTSSEELELEVGCWVELFPLQESEQHQNPPEQVEVLFELSDGRKLADLASEMLRLGNDRQSYRWLDPQDSSTKARALLQVVGPPYYSLLRALSTKEIDAPKAFLKQGPNIWVELGYTHPFIDQIKAPPEQMLLLSAPRDWLAVDAAPFRDIYEGTELILPERQVVWQDGEIEKKLEVSLRLTRSGTPVAAELWILRDNPIQELNSFVQKSEEDVLRRLSFAVGGTGEDLTIAIRVRPSKEPPPVLIFSEGQEVASFRPYSKMPNLFLPCGWQLHPPLRRDKVRSLLADDPATLTWLYPLEAGEFQVEKLSEDAFRPLTDWVEYIIDHEQEPIQAWMQATHFDFETFICDEEDKPKPKKPPTDDKDRSKKKKPPKRGHNDGDLQPFAPVIEDENEEDVLTEIEDFITLTEAPPDQNRIDLDRLEEEFVTYEGGLDSEERQGLWPEMARLNAALGHAEDGGICWMNALWHTGSTRADWLWNWFMTEAHAFTEEGESIRKPDWAAKAAANPMKPSVVAGEDLDKVLRMKDPHLADIRSLASYVVYASHRKTPPTSLEQRLNKVQQFIERYEQQLPIRCCWLTWRALSHLAGGDVLLLARARDRILERLFHSGLRPEQDLPSFLRFSGQPTNQRFRAVREWMSGLCNDAHKWSKDNRYEQLNDDSFAATGAYIDLLFAFAMARMGEVDACRDLVDRATERLKKIKEGPHSFLLEVFLFRINLVRENKPYRCMLSDDLRDQMTNENMERLQKYAVERLFQHSRILAPDQTVDPYRHWTANVSDLEKELASLTDTTDKKEIIEKVEKLWKDQPGKGKQAQEIRARILQAALEVAPRVNEEFALEMLGRLGPTFDALPEAKDQGAHVRQARLLEKGIFVAAHFDRMDHVQELLGRFQHLIQDLKGSSTQVQTLDKLAGECFRGLRKLGMRDEIDMLLGEMADLVLDGDDPLKIQVKERATWPEELKTLLHVAGGWFYFGRDQQAEPIINATRSLLFTSKDLADSRKKTRLAGVYAGTVGQANVDVAQKSLEEIFEKLRDVKDSYTTNKFYSLSHLDLLESVVMAIVNDDFTMGANAQRWLDDDEFLVRRRIHTDFRGQK